MKTRSEETKKNRGRKNRFLVCFCPAADFSDAVTRKKPVGKANSGKSGLDPLLTYISVAKEELIPVIISPISKRNQPVSAPEIEGTEGDALLKRRRKIARRLFARIVKAANFENLTGKVQQDAHMPSISSENGSSVMNRKLFDEKPAFSLPESTRTRRKFADKVSQSSHHQFESINFFSSSSTKSKILRSCSSSKSHSSTSVESKHSNQQTCSQKTAKIAGKFHPATGLYLLVISLSIMLIWGRVCAIVCTSTWLYFVPRLEIVNTCRENDDLPENATESLEIDTIEYKKKVIMEGFLERNHRV